MPGATRRDQPSQRRRETGANGRSSREYPRVALEHIGYEPQHDLHRPRPRGLRGRGEPDRLTPDFLAEAHEFPVAVAEHAGKHADSDTGTYRAQDGVRVVGAGDPGAGCDDLVEPVEPGDVGDPIRVSDETMPRPDVRGLGAWGLLRVCPGRIKSRPN